MLGKIQVKVLRGRVGPKDNLVGQRGICQVTKVPEKGFAHGGCALALLLLEVTIARIILFWEWGVMGVLLGPVFSAERMDDLLSQPQTVQHMWQHSQAISSCQIDART